MNNWFECRVRYEKILANGLQKKVTEPYLVDAMSHTEAEARFIEEITPFISGEFEVIGIKPGKINELFFNDNGNRYYKAKVMFITLDEKSGAEKRTATNMYAQACSIEEALGVINDGMKGTMADYEITSIAETPIMDVFIYGTGQ